MDLETIKSTIEQEYNKYATIEIVRPESGDPHVRLTGGSGGHYYVNIFQHGPSLVLEGEKHGEMVADSCVADEAVLIGRLSKRF